MQVKFSFYLSSVPDNIHAIKFIWRHFKILLFNYLRINSLVHKSFIKILLFVKGTRKLWTPEVFL